MRTQDLWTALSAQSFPYLHELSSVDRDRFVLLDAYLRDCLEEWCVSGGQLSARSIVLLDDCTLAITRRPISVFRQLSRLDNVKPAKKQAHVTLKCL